MLKDTKNQPNIETMQQNKRTKNEARPELWRPTIEATEEAVAAAIATEKRLESLEGLVGTLLADVDRLREFRAGLFATAERPQKGV